MSEENYIRVVAELDDETRRRIDEFGFDAKYQGRGCDVAQESRIPDGSVQWRRTAVYIMSGGRLVC